MGMFPGFQFSSVAQSCPTLCYPMNRSHLILCRPLLLLPPIPPSIRVFSNESALRRRWPKYWSFSFSIIPFKEIPGLISCRMTGWISLQSKGLSRVSSNTTVQKHQFSLCQAWMCPGDAEVTQAGPWSGRSSGLPRRGGLG